MRLEYVLSGLSHTKITTPYFDPPVLIDMGCQALKYVSTHTDHDLGLLFNAMVEPSFPKKFVNYRDSVKYIHSDSGGLQLAQKGKPLTPEVEAKIYKTQALNSNISMSIDKIPLEIIPGMGDPRTDMSCKRFVVSENKDAGIESGQNLYRQIQAFKKYRKEDTKNYDSKPLMIIQGNALEDYVEYFDNILAQIPEEDYSMIGGYALAGSAIGIGTLEAMDTLFSFLALDKPKQIPKKIHLLGYGSVQRLMPVLSLKETFFSDYEISYDSTTHTSKYNFGGVLGEHGGDVSFGMQDNPEGREVFGKVYDRFADVIKSTLGVDRQRWVDVIVSDLTGSTRYHSLDEAGIIHRSGPLLCSLYSAYNFIKLVDKTEKNIRTSKHSFTGVLHNIQRNVKSPEHWFEEYRDKVGIHLPSNRIKRIDFRGNYGNNLDSFFE